MTDSETTIMTVSQPTDLKANLFQHQLASVYKMEKLEREKMIEKENDIFIETRIAVNADPTGYGKCFGKNTKILMFDGSIKYVQDIIVGDLLMGDDSLPRQVLSLASGKEKMYEIIQKSGGDNYSVNESHILSLKMDFAKRIIKGEKETKVEYFCKDSMKILYKIFSSMERAIQYFNSLNIETKVDIELKEYFKLSHYIRRHLKGYRVSLDFKEIIKKEEPYILGNRIPKYLLINSKYIRINVLACIIDYTQSEYDRGKFILTIEDENYGRDIVFLSRSLGYTSIIKKHDNKYRVIIIGGKSLYEIPVQEKINVLDNTFDDETNCLTSIKIKELSEDTYYGFTISGNRRFLLHDCTVVHNTLSMVTLILRNKMEWDMEAPFVNEILSTDSLGLIKRRKIKRYDKLPTTLVLVSQSIINQWKSELEKTNLKIYIVSSHKEIEQIKAEENDVVLVTTTMFNSLMNFYPRYAWKRFIYDEPGHMKVPGMKIVVAGFYWLVTATPGAITQKHKNCKGSFMRDIVGYGYSDFDIKFDGLIVRNEISFVYSSFSMPSTNHINHECYQPIFNTVNGLVNDQIQTMIEAGNILGAITALGGNKTSNIVDLIRDKKNEDLREADFRIEIYTRRNDEVRTKEWKDRKDRIIKQIEELESRFNENLKGCCNICLDIVKSPVLEPNCQNIFCGQCLLTWLQRNNKCPLCRNEISTNELIYIQKEDEVETIQETVVEKRKMTKLEKICDIIKNKPEGKFLIFSNYDESFEPICKVLKENNIKFAEIKGTITTRTKNLQMFKNGELNVIFLNSNFNGSGLNLQEASDIILYHDMSENNQNQILGRANRIGRTQSLQVHHLKVDI